jgi:hypothetical protein
MFSQLYSQQPSSTTSFSPSIITPHDYNLYDQQRSALEARELVARQQERRTKEIAVIRQQKQQLLLKQQQLQRAAEEEHAIVRLRQQQIQQEQRRQLALQQQQQQQQQQQKQQRSISAQRSLEEALLFDLFSQFLGAEVEEVEKEAVEVKEPIPVIAAPVSSVPASIPTTSLDLAPVTVENVIDIPENDEALQQLFESHRHRRSNLSTLSTLTTDLTSHKTSFTLPTKLIFSTPSTSSDITDNDAHKLAFSSINAPFLAYEDYLVGLLSKADAIESEGDRLVKNARKELVKSIEGELERLDSIREESWRMQNTVADDSQGQYFFLYLYRLQHTYSI